MSEFTDSMMQLHELLERGFFAHQQALLNRDFKRAAATLAHYRERLAWHMEDEEALILPKYVALGGDQTDAPLRLFLGEHQKLREFLAEFERRVQDLTARPDDHRLLDLFDRQATYKNLMLHHDLRERNMLYPLLAAQLTENEQDKLWNSVNWQGTT